MSQKNYKCYAPDSGLGWRVVRWISFAYGERKVADGRWQRVYDGAGNHVGYQLLDSSRIESGLPVIRSHGAVSARESVINAGAHFRSGRSRTAGLSEIDRLSRVDLRTGKKLAPEDLVERITMKVRLWPQSANLSTGDKAIRVYPKSAEGADGNLQR